MLYLSLIASSIVLLLANLFAWKAKQPSSKILEISIAAALISFVSSCLVFLPPVLCQAVLLGVLALIGSGRHWRRRTLVLFSCAATLCVYGIIGVIAFLGTKHLQKEFPYVSIKGRLPSLTTMHADSPLPPATADHLVGLEDRLEQDNRKWIIRYRTDSLRAIHEETMKVFVDQQGFGVTRMGGMRKWLLRGGARQRSPIPQPGTPSPSPWIAQSLQHQQDATDGLRSLHDASLLDFVNPVGFGFIKDRQHVAGFLEHQVSEMPAAPERWALHSLDLIGLVIHKEPVAYLSENLPRMDELRAAPTRSLDEFETAGLAALRRGDDLFVRDQGQDRRMLGAIRVMRQCLACHGGERGNLLGAFSYTLKHDGKESP